MLSIIAMVLAILTFGALVRKLRYVPPWAITGSLLTAVGSGLSSTLQPDATLGQWLGYQILTHLGRGVAFQGVRVLLPTFFTSSLLKILW